MLVVVVVRIVARDRPIRPLRIGMRNRAPKVHARRERAVVSQHGVAGTLVRVSLTFDDVGKCLSEKIYDSVAISPRMLRGVDDGQN